MSKQLSRGTKRICQSSTCALPFYDLNRADISCPNCGAVFDASVVLYPRSDPTKPGSWQGGRRPMHQAVPKSIAPFEPSQPADEEEVEEEPASATDEVIDADADTLPLEDDADDEMADVVIPPADEIADR